LLVIAFLEVLAVSFFYKREDRSEAIGETSSNVIDIGLISGMIISAFVFVYVDFTSMYVRVAV